MTRQSQEVTVELKSHPLETAVCHFFDGELWMSGNRTLISLNLSRNRVGERGLRALLDAVRSQDDPPDDSLAELPPQGLRRLLVHRNAVPDDDASVASINRYMKLRDPLVPMALKASAPDTALTAACNILASAADDS